MHFVDPAEPSDLTLDTCKDVSFSTSVLSFPNLAKEFLRLSPAIQEASMKMSAEDPGMAEEICNHETDPQPWELFGSPRPLQQGVW